MSFLKSYYNSVSSFLVGDEEEENEKVDQVPPKEESIEPCQVQESKSEGWLSGIYNSAYNNSGEVWKAVKTDLSEFACVVSKDAKTVVAKTANGVKYSLMGEEGNVDGHPVGESDSATSKIKAGLNRMFEQVSKTLYIPPDSDDDDFYYNAESGSQTICSRIDTRIAQLQADRNTFTTDPTLTELDTDLGDFSTWKEKLNLEDFKSTIAELIKTNQLVLDNFTELVPNPVPFDDFWTRYFYRVASVKAEESRREALKLRLCHEENAVVGNDPGDWDEANDITEESCSLSGTTVVLEESKVVVEVQSGNVEETANVTNVKCDEKLKIKEKDDVVLVKHTESSSASEDNNLGELSTEQKETDDFASWDDDDVDVEVTEDDLELAKNVSDKDVLESKWEDWS